MQADVALKLVEGFHVLFQSVHVREVLLSQNHKVVLLLLLLHCLLPRLLDPLDLPFNLEYVAENQGNLQYTVLLTKLVLYSPERFEHFIQ